MLDWIFSQNCRNSLPLDTAEGVQNIRRCCTYKLLTANTSDGSYHIEEYKNLSLVLILRCLNTTTMGHFHYLYERLWKNHKIKGVCFFSFYNGCKPACKVRCRPQMGEW